MTVSDPTFATGRATTIESAAPVARQTIELGAGRSIAYARTGSGPDLIAVHGTLMTLDEMWLGPVPALAEHFTVTVVDRPGHGFSRRHGHLDASPWRQAELIHAAAEQLGLVRPVMLGHSFGGTVALAYALRFPESTAGVVALAPVCRPEPRLEQWLFGPFSLPGVGSALARSGGLPDRLAGSALPPLYRAIFAPQAMPDRFAVGFPFPLTARGEAMVAEGEDALALPLALAGMAPLYPSCRTPVHILAGTADPVVNNALHGGGAARWLRDGRFTWVEGFGHMLHHFATEQVVAAALDIAREA